MTTELSIQPSMKQPIRLWLYPAAAKRKSEAESRSVKKWLGLFPYGSSPQALPGEGRREKVTRGNNFLFLPITTFTSPSGTHRLIDKEMSLYRIPIIVFVTFSFAATLEGDCVNVVIYFLFSLILL